jgi:hypothetical protein
MVVLSIPRRMPSLLGETCIQGYNTVHSKHHGKIRQGAYIKPVCIKKPTGLIYHGNDYHPSKEDSMTSKMVHQQSRSQLSCERELDPHA